MDTSPGYRGLKPDLLKRLRRIEGHVRGLHQMVEADAYCIDVLTRGGDEGATERHGRALLDEHIRHCVTEAVASDSEDAERLVTEASRAIERLVKS